jgi:copper(I)-binding protein
MKTAAYLCAAVLAVLAGSAGAQQSSTMEVQHAWARASAGTTGAAYFIVTNKGSAPDRLVAAATPVAGEAELHESKSVFGIMQMRPLGPLDIAPGQSAELKPGANHVMLMGLKQPLKEGDSFPLTLSFEKAGDVEVTVKVERASAMGAAAGPSAPAERIR